MSHGEDGAGVAVIVVCVLNRAVRLMRTEETLLTDLIWRAAKLARLIVVIVCVVGF